MNRPTPKTKKNKTIIWQKSKNNQNLQQTFHNTTHYWLVEQQHALTSSTPNTHTLFLFYTHSALSLLLCLSLLSFSLLLCEFAGKETTKTKEKTMSSIEGQSSSASTTASSTRRRRCRRRRLQESRGGCGGCHHTHSVVGQQSGHQWYWGCRRAARGEPHHSLATDQQGWHLRATDHSGDR